MTPSESDPAGPSPVPPRLRPVTGSGPTPSLHRLVKESREWRGWVGSDAELGRIYSLVAELAADRSATAVAQLTVGRGENVETTIGPFEEIIRIFDRRRWDRLAMRVGRSWDDDNLEVTLIRHRPGGSGVTLKVSSTDVGWKSRAVRELSDEIDRGTAWWHRLHSGVAAMLMSVVLLSAPLALILFRVNTLVNGTLAELTLIDAAIMVPFALVGFSFIRVLHRALPPVEVYAAGGSSAGGRRLAVLIAGILVPALIPYVILLLVG